MKVLFISLGCDKNLVDSEFMLGKLTHHKFTVTDDEQEADIIVINTCCFIHDAKEESIQSILDMAQYRTGGNCKALIVCGCLAERFLRLRPVHRLQPGNHILHSRQLLPQPVTDGSG